MTNGTVPDTGLIEAFRPLKTGADGGGSSDKPACGNCMFGTKEGPGVRELSCMRYPPELTMGLKVNPLNGQPMQVPNVGFKPVHSEMVCGEHPLMQVRMKRAVAAAEARAYGLIPADRGQPGDGVALGAHVEHLVVATGTVAGEQKANMDRLLAESFKQTAARVGDPGVPVHAIGDDRRKPGDDPT